TSSSLDFIEKESAREDGRITERDINHWQKAFPNINVRGQLEAMAGWLKKLPQPDRLAAARNRLAKVDQEALTARAAESEKAKAGEAKEARKAEADATILQDEKAKAMGMTKFWLQAWQSGNEYIDVRKELLGLMPLAKDFSELRDLLHQRNEE